jgi:hypothetical protein
MAEGRLAKLTLEHRARQQQPIVLAHDDTQAGALRAVLEERLRQNDRWGNAEEHLSFEWLAVLTEEVGEVAKAMITVHFELPAGRGIEGIEKLARIEGIAHLRQELVQTAAVALKMLERLDSYMIHDILPDGSSYQGDNDE